MNRTRLCVVLLFVALISSACSPKVVVSPTEQPSQDTIVIGVCVQDRSNEFITLLCRTMLERAEKYDHVKIMIEDGEAKASRQYVQVEKFIAQGVDVIILNPTDGEYLVSAVEDAIKEGIPVITLSSDLNIQVGQTYCGSPNITGGELIAKYVCEKLNGKGNIAILKGPLNHYATIKRYTGILNVLKDYPEVRTVFCESGNWQREQGMYLMQTWLSTDAQIDAVIAENDAMMLGAIAAIENAGLRGKIVTVGMDAIDEALSAIKDGTLGASCFQDSIGQANAAIDLAVKAANGQEIDNFIIPFELVTQENADEYFSRVRKLEE